MGKFKALGGIQLKIIILTLMIIIFSFQIYAAPTHSNPIVYSIDNSASGGQNLFLSNISTVKTVNESVYNAFRIYVNGTVYSTSPRQSDMNITALYPFIEDKPVDYSGHGFNLTKNGNILFYNSPDMYVGYYNFSNSNAYLTSSNSGLDSIGLSYTFIVLYKGNDSSGVLVSKGNTGGTSNWNQLQIADGKPYYQRWNGGACNPVASSSFYINDSKQHLIAEVYNLTNSMGYLFVDGVLDVNVSDTCGDLRSTVDFTIGADTIGGSKIFGNIGFVAVYNRSLNNDELLKIDKALRTNSTFNTTIINSSVVVNSSSIIGEITPTDSQSEGTPKNSSAFRVSIQLKNFTIYDEYFGKSISVNKEIFMKIIGNTIINLTNNSNSLIQANLSIGDYRIEYYADGYTRRDYYISITSDLTSNTNLYLLSSGNSTNVVFTVQDQNSQQVINATIKVLKFMEQTNAYDIVAMSKTDSNGQSQINIELFNSFYYFVVEKDSATLLITNPSRIISTAITLNTVIGEDIFKSREGIRYVDTFLYFNNVTDIFYFTYNDPVNVVSEVCLIVERITLMNKVELCNNCSDSSSGTLQCEINRSIEGTYRGFGKIESNTQSSSFITDIIEFFSKEREILTSTIGKTGVYLTSYLIMGLSLLAVPVPWISVLFALAGVIFSSITGVLGLGYVAVTTLIVIGSLIIYKSR